MPNIETTNTRSSRISSFLATLGITIAIIAGSGASYYVLPSVHLYDREYTLNEYDQLKPIFTTLMDSRESRLLTFAEAEIWKDIMAYELRKCGSWEFSNINQDNSIDLINAKLKTNKC